MIINKPKNYDELETATFRDEPIEPGGHYMVILGAEHRQGQNANGQWSGMNIKCDFHETDYQAGAIRADYERRKTYKNEGWWPPAGSKLVFLPNEDPASGRGIKAFIEALEASNAGFKYDWAKPFEEQIKGKTIGAVIREKEWEFDGNTGFFPELWYFCAADEVKDTKIPKPLYLDGNKPKEPAKAEPEVDKSFLPFEM